MESEAAVQRKEANCGYVATNGGKIRKILNRVLWGHQVNILTETLKKSTFLCFLSRGVRPARSPRLSSRNYPPSSKHRFSSICGQQLRKNAPDSPWAL